MTHAHSGRAPRKLGFWLTTALVVGNIIGSAIFLLPASLAPHGWNVVSGWGVTLAGALCLAWVFAQLARHLPNAGGSFGFMQLGVGESLAFLGAWGYVVSVWAGNAAITIGGVSYLTRLVPPLANSPMASLAAALTAVWLFTAVNLRGMRTAGGVSLVTSIIKLLPFVAVIGLALWRLFERGAGALPPITSDSFTLAGVTATVPLTMYAMAGLESAAVPADAVENPERTVPRATMVGTALSAVVSIVATCAAALMLPVAQVSASKAPISDFIATGFGDVAGVLVAVCAVVSCFGCLNGWLLLSGQLPAAMADANRLPRWFGERNAAGAPARAILLGSVLTSLLLTMSYSKTGVGIYNFSLLLATATSLLMYLFCAVAVFTLARRGTVPRSAGLTVAAIGGLVFVVWALVGSGTEALMWGAVLIAAGWPVYLIARRVTAGTVAAPASLT